MSFKERRASFNKRFGIVDNSDAQQEMNEFKRRVFNIFEDIDYHIEDESIERFCTHFAHTIKKTGTPYSSSGPTRIQLGNNIINILKNENNDFTFFLLIETIFTLHFTDPSGRYSKSRLINDIKEAVDISNINLSISIINNSHLFREEVILHPRGEEKLDTILLEETFSFLNPKANEHFLSALKFYSKRKPQDSIKSAESIRRCIEEFLRFKLNNKKGLDKNIEELGSRLKSGKTALELRNIIKQIFAYLERYFNENSKHNDGEIGEAENEFLLYQSGLLMRYINRILKS